MRAVFGVVSLLIALAIVGLVAVRQLKALGHVGAPPAAASASPETAALPQLSGSGNVGDQARQLEKQVAADVANSLNKDAARTEEAEKP